MRPLFIDTNPDIERFHIELIRKAPIFHRLEIVTSLIQATRKLSWRGICERYPHETAEARLRRFFLLLYGDKFLAERVISLRMEKGIQ